MQLELTADRPGRRTISPFRELGAYEALWDNVKATFKSIADQFARRPAALPSDFVKPETAEEYAASVNSRFRESEIGPFGVRVHGAAEYPPRLRDAKHPVELLYFQGWWDLVNSRSVAVVGSREPSDEGKARTRRIVKALVEDDFTVVSGLAAGIDTAAHTAAIDNEGRTIAVIGTPLSHVYPKTNSDLQKRIAENYLLISQVPLLRYERQDYRRNRLFFPERNKTMSALTEATIIVEAGETSGTLIQARAALEQGRKLFILDSCFQNPKLTWPAKFEMQGAVRVRTYDDVRRHLST
ncbi:DNA-processing protein DprA [Hoeflea sp.]|uniref:DNA-processing protein DprA n=1 Tax=Hoeflea sp. TaxID=1940281 RepID=UPI003B01C28C